MNALVGAEVDRAVVAVFAEAEGDLVELNVPDGVECILVVAVDNEQTRGQLSELLKGLLDVVEVLEVVEVVGVDVEDNRDEGIKFEEGVNVLASLTDDDVALTYVAVAADEGQLAADDSGRVKAAADKYLREHRGGCGLAVRTRNGDASLVASCNYAEHNAALNAGNTLFCGGLSLGVGFLDSGGVNNELCALDILRGVTHVNGNTVALDAVEGLALVHIGARKLKALAPEDLGERAHSAAADSDKMDSFYMIQKLIIIHSKHSHIKLIYSYYKAKNAKNKVPNANFIKSVAKSAAQC